MPDPIKLYDGSGRVVTEFHPSFKDRMEEIQFSSGYNPVPSRRGSSGGLYQNAGSETWQKNRDRLRAIWDSRDAVKYTWIGGVLARLVLYVCGQIHCKSNTGDDGVNEMYDSYWKAWCGEDTEDEDDTDGDGLMRCDITGRHQFLKMIQMSFFGYFMDGDYGFVEVDPLWSPTGEYCLQGIEADRIGSPLEATTFEDYIGGVGLDINTGRVKFYRVYRRTRTNQYVDKAEIPPQAFIHVFDPERSDEYRGTTKLLRALNDLRDLREWVEAEKQAIKTQSQWAAMVGLKDPFSNQGPFAWSGQTKNGTPYQEAEWGKILRMAEGENFSMVTPASRPSGAAMGFAETLIRMMAISFGISYGLLWDLATLGGATARIEVQSDLRKIQYWQRMLVKLVCNRVRRKVISQGIAREEIPACPGWKKASWNFGPHITADLGYEMEADISGVTNGFLKLEDMTLKHSGATPREIFEANARSFNTAIAVGAEQGAPVETFAPALYPNGTNQKAAYLTPAPIPPPPPMSVEAIGDKVMGKVIEIMEKVGDGTIDRESAINMLCANFPDMPRKKIEKLVPKEPTPADLNRAAGLDVKGRHPPAAKVSSSNGSKNGSKKPASRN